MTADERAIAALFLGALIGFTAGACMILLWAETLPVHQCAPMVCVDPGCALAVRSE